MAFKYVQPLHWIWRTSWKTFLLLGQKEIPASLYDATNIIHLLKDGNYLCTIKKEINQSLYSHKFIRKISLNICTEYLPLNKKITYHYSQAQPGTSWAFHTLGCKMCQFKCVCQKINTSFILVTNQDNSKDKYLGFFTEKLSTSRSSPKGSSWQWTMCCLCLS